MSDLHEMRGSERGGRRARRLSALTGLVVAVAIGALLHAGLALGGSSERTTSAAAAKPVVGEVTLLGGTKHLYLQGNNGNKTALRKGDELRLDSTVLAGAGVKAQLKLTTPKSVSPDRELVFVKPLEKTKHSVTLVRISDTAVKVTITD